MASSLAKFLTDLNMYKKLYITMIILMIMHIAYLMVFLLTDKIYLALLNVVSVAIYIYVAYIIKRYQNARLALTVAQIEIFLHAFICAFTLGWEYGFQNIILVLISVAFFSNFTSKIFSYTMAFAQVVAYIFLYVYFKDAVKVPNFEAEIMHIFNFILVVIFLVFFSTLSRIFNAMTYINMLDRQEELEVVANKDALTGLYNRRAFENIICKNILESKGQASIVMGDLDDFKKINDNFGHSAGDEVLKTVANIIKTGLRRHDFACRWGGEEFLIIIINTDFNNSQLILNRLRNKIVQNIFIFNGKQSSISMTFGFVCVNIDENLDVIAAIKKADKLLYKGKKNGKNCVVGEIVASTRLLKEDDTADS